MIFAALAQAVLIAGSPSSVGMSPERLRKCGLDTGIGDTAGEYRSRFDPGGTARQDCAASAALGVCPTRKADPVTPDSVFLLASITKPVTACALMLLVERGKVSLSDPVSRYLPEFTGDERDKVRVRDLLSHTSGMPDMLPENVALRRAQRSSQRVCRGASKLLCSITPGTSFSLPKHGDSACGRDRRKSLRDAAARFRKEGNFRSARHAAKFSWDWVRYGFQTDGTGLGVSQSQSARHRTIRANSPYWRDMGHPWGGMHSTRGDLAIGCSDVPQRGRYSGKRIFSPATVKAMTSDQNPRVHAPWGLGLGARALDCLEFFRRS